MNFDSQITITIKLWYSKTKETICYQIITHDESTKIKLYIVHQSILYMLMIEVQINLTTIGGTISNQYKRRILLHCILKPPVLHSTARKLGMHLLL